MRSIYHHFHWHGVAMLQVDPEKLKYIAQRVAGKAPYIVPRAPKGRPAGASELELYVEKGLRQVCSPLIIVD
eukprot:SAG31_NODE_4233_length_3434_cov_1.980810_1_plen_72_part_00